MEKIKLDIIGISYSQSQSGAYALILGESGGRRRLPIIIGGFEAQAIAIELEKMKPARPLTHDLFKNVLDCMECRLMRVVIRDVVESTFYAVLVLEHDGVETEIDARPSDAIALGLRCSAPSVSCSGGCFCPITRIALAGPSMFC